MYNRLRKAALVCASLFASIVFACDSKPPSRPETVTLYLNWILTGSFAGEAVAAEEVDKEVGLELVLRPGGQGLDPLKLVSDGDIGISSADEILRAIDKGRDLVIVGCANDDSPAAFVSLKSSGIDTPKKFEGRRVGILPFGSTGLVYQALLESAHVDRSKITEVIVSPDLRAFLTANVNDVQPIFIYDETVTLDKQLVQYNLIIPKDWGVVFKGPCYFTTRSTVEKEPDLVGKVVYVLASGWQRALADPEKAIAYLTTLDPTLSADRELKVLKRGTPYYASEDRRPLETKESTWPQFVSLLHRYGVISKPLDPSHFLDLRFISRVYGNDTRH